MGLYELHTTISKSTPKDTFSLIELLAGSCTTIEICDIKINQRYHHFWWIHSPTKETPRLFNLNLKKCNLTLKRAFLDECKFSVQVSVDLEVFLLISSLNLDSLISLVGHQNKNRSKKPLLVRSPMSLALKGTTGVRFGCFEAVSWYLNYWGTCLFYTTQTIYCL